MGTRKAFSQEREKSGHPMKETHEKAAGATGGKGIFPLRTASLREAVATAPDDNLETPC